MHQRKAEMARQSQAFIALPGARPDQTSPLLKHNHHRPTALAIIQSPPTPTCVCLRTATACWSLLPGGYGTMEELLEMITWCQLGIHDKPVSELTHAHCR